MQKSKVAVLGATGMVGQRLLVLLEDHPYFDVVKLAASPRSAGKKYGELMESRWKLDHAVPEYTKELVVEDLYKIDEVAEGIDMVFCAINLDKEALIKLEEDYAKREVVVVSNNSANRNKDDVPMIIPEINSAHLDVLPAQRKRLGTKKGFIVTKPNCSIQSYVPIFEAIKEYGVKEASICFGKVVDGKIIPDNSMKLSAQCIRVPVLDGHLACVSFNLENNPGLETLVEKIKNHVPEIAKHELPLAPTPFIKYYEENDRPQPVLDRDNEKGMQITVGRLREDNLFDYKFVGLSHNTLRGAAGGAVLTAELIKKLGYLD